LDRVVIVSKASRLEELTTQHLTEGAAGFVLETRGHSIAPYRDEHAAYAAALALIRRQIPKDLAVAAVRREELPHFLFRDSDLIVVCGPDGLFVNVAKYVKDQPVVTVNPDPNQVAGALMLFEPPMVGAVIDAVKSERHRVERLPFVRAAINDDEQIVWGINDVFVGRGDHVSARYEIAFAGQREHHSSSGVIISTGVGATGWLSSIVAMADGLAGGRQAAGALMSLPKPASSELVFVVREPFASPATGTALVTGRVRPGRPLVLYSEMAAGGCVFSDGIVERAAEWNTGSTVSITVGDRYVQRVIG
jgi:hypothetical protein